MHRVFEQLPSPGWLGLQCLQFAELFQPSPSLMALPPLCYRELLETTCRLANTLKRYGVRRGDRVAIYMPVSPLAVAAMLACARIGAIHNVIFAGFSVGSLAGRINDGEHVGSGMGKKSGSPLAFRDSGWWQTSLKVTETDDGHCQAQCVAE